MQFDRGASVPPQVAAAVGVGALMRAVIYALLPGTLLSAWYFGWGVLSNIVLSILFSLAHEALALHLRRRSIVAGWSDGSAVVTAWLLALALPPMSSWWLLAIGAGFAVLVAKHIYGGLGCNPFNPAMVGYVVLLISFPREMTQWLSPLPPSGGAGAAALNLADTIRTVLGVESVAAARWDMLTGATPLDLARAASGAGTPTTASAGDDLPGPARAWIALAWLAGGLWLIYRQVITWHIPLALLLSLSLIAAGFYWIDAERYASPWFHLCHGAALLGAFFIATDPVTAASSNVGRVVYAAGIGLITYVIRTWGGYPDGIAFAVLLANICAPTIDQYIRPRTFGH